MDADILLYAASGWQVGSTWTDVAGRFKFQGLATGNYFAVASAYDHRSELFLELPCSSSCIPTAGTPIPVTLGAATTGTDFTLDRMGSITGTVTEATTGEPIYDIAVEAVNSSGSLMEWTYSGADGRYEIGGLQPGTYFVRTSGYFDHEYINELYDDEPCPSSSCPPTTGTPIAVALNSPAAGIDFALDRGGRIEGRLTDAVSGDPVEPWSRVEIWSNTGAHVQGTLTDGNGNYRAYGLPAGTYFATASSSGYLAELYDNIPCGTGAPSGCVPTSGTPIPAALNDTTPGIDFTLSPLGKISGTVTDATSGLPLNFAHVRVWRANGSSITDASTGSSGIYVTSGLPPGDYFVTAAEEGHAGELFDGIPCPASIGCDPTTGTAVPVTVNTTATVNFALWRRGAIAGTVIDAITGAPLDDTQVQAFTAGGNQAAYTLTDPAGRYTIFVDPGNYAAVASSHGHVAEVFDDIPCSWFGCPTGTPIVVATATVDGIDFALRPGPGIYGRVTDDSNGAPLAGIAIDLWDAGGNLVSSAITNGSGNYALALSAGTYFVSTYNGRGGVDEVYDDIACPLGSAYDGLCNPTSGTPVTVQYGVPAATGVDFALSDIPIFKNGFENGNTSGWSGTVGN